MKISSDGLEPLQVNPLLKFKRSFNTDCFMVSSVFKVQKKQSMMVSATVCCLNSQILIHTRHHQFTSWRNVFTPTSTWMAHCAWTFSKRSGLLFMMFEQYFCRYSHSSVNQTMKVHSTVKLHRCGPTRWHIKNTSTSSTIKTKMLDRRCNESLLS